MLIKKNANKEKCGHYEGAEGVARLLFKKSFRVSTVYSCFLLEQLPTVTGQTAQNDLSEAFQSYSPLQINSLKIVSPINHDDASIPVAMLILMALKMLNCLNLLPETTG